MTASHHSPPALPPAPEWADPALREVIAADRDGVAGIVHAAEYGHNVELRRFDDVVPDGLLGSVTEVCLGGTRFLELDEAESLARALLAAVATGRGGAE